MAIKDAKVSNAPETMKALVGEKIMGVIQDYKGRWWLVVESGHALVVGGSDGSPVYWPETPDNVKALIKERQKELGAWMEEAKKVMDIEGVIAKND